MTDLTITADQITESLRSQLSGWEPDVTKETVGYVTSIADGVAQRQARIALAESSISAASTSQPSLASRAASHVRWTSTEWNAAQRKAPARARLTASLREVLM